MLGGVLAISDFMLMLVVSALWVAGFIVCAGLVGVGTIGGLAIAARRWWRAR
ncbi:MAG TPA: hypothetical protein VNT42_14845 [Sphingomonas sp.]|nr:hypothetical protein [Sphingomonas sp.]